MEETGEMNEICVWLVRRVQWQTPPWMARSSLCTNINTCVWLCGLVCVGMWQPTTDG